MQKVSSAKKHETHKRETMFSNEEYMKMAFSLARRGEGETSPNPIVGALVVKNGRVVGKGFHRKAGEKHAEISALEEAGESARGATLYLNLEPCCHYGKTPPCCAQIIRAGISRVVCSMKDPNPIINGKGIENIRAAGLHVDVGLMENEARKLNEIFLKYMTTGKPFVIAKAAMSIDGKIATASGESQWISSEESRNYIHNRIRYSVDAILIGINTVLMDDPLLTVRGVHTRKKKIIRIILDSTLKIPHNLKLFDSLEDGEIWIYTLRNGKREKIKKLMERGAQVIEIGGVDGRCSMKEVNDDIGARKISSVLIEGGSQILASALRSEIVDVLYFFIASMIIGGGASISVFGELLRKMLKESIQLDHCEAIPIERDIMYRAYPRYR